MNNLICHKKQNKVYLKILRNLSFPKSPKTPNLDKPTKSYKGFKIQGPKRNNQGPVREVKGPNLKSNELPRLNLPKILLVEALTSGAN